MIGTTRWTRYTSFGTGTRPVWPTTSASTSSTTITLLNNVLDLEPNFLPPNKRKELLNTIYTTRCKAAETGRMVDGKDRARNYWYNERQLQQKLELIYVNTHKLWWQSPAHVELENVLTCIKT